MRGVFASGPKIPAIFSNFNARRFSVRTELPGDIYQFECEAFFGQNQSPWRYLPIRMLGVILSEPEFLAIFSSLNSLRFSVRTQVPGSIYQLESKVFVGQDRNAWRYSPIWMRGAFRSETKFLAIFASVNARRFFGQNQNPWRYFAD